MAGAPSKPSSWSLRIWIACGLAELERRELDDTDGLVVFAGAARLLAALPSDRWAVVTSGTRRLATKRLQLAGLPVPEKLVSAEEVRLGKPDPAPFLRGAELLGLRPADCVVVEDAPSGNRSRASGWE